MPDVIQLLPDNVANQIAAGEVVQRPASLVKELIENAIDAGAGKIQLIVKDAGKSLVQVIDDGCGMTDTDARLCFEKHATSKIKSVDDLFSIQTKGFRGEAMASIAAVAQVEMKTRRAGDDVGTRIVIEGSEIKVQEPCSTPPGTSIMVKNLFFNIPARRNFLKSNPVETKHIIEEFQRIAFTHPDVSMEMHHNGNEIFNLNTGTLRQRIVALMGKNYNEKLVPIEEETTILNLKGFIGKPEAARKTRGEQYFFVNDRFIKSPYFNHAVMGGYDELISSDQYPSYFIYMDVDPATIDVNIHPTKTEVKFEDERSIYAILKSAVKQSLGRYNITPTLDFEQETSFNVTPLPKDKTVSAPNIKPDPEYNPFKLSSAQSDFTSRKVSSTDIAALEDMYARIDIEKSENPQEQLEITAENGEDVEIEEQKLPYQLHRKYVINHIKSGFIVIDQQRAHERILYEQFVQKIANNTVGSQQMMFPLTLELSQQDIRMLQSVRSELNGIGFDISEFGNGSIIINGIPAVLSESDVGAALEEVLKSLSEELTTIKLGEKLARSLAKSTGIKKGQQLGIEEMQTLIDELFACEQPFYTPSGKPTTVTVPLNELEKKFEG